LLDTQSPIHGGKGKKIKEAEKGKLCPYRAALVGRRVSNVE